MRTEAGKMPESLIFLTENSPGVSNDRFGFRPSGGDLEGWRGAFQRRIAELSDVKNASKTPNSPRWANKILKPVSENSAFSGLQEISNSFSIIQQVFLTDFLEVLQFFLPGSPEFFLLHPLADRIGQAGRPG